MLPQPSSKVLVGVAGWSYPDWRGMVFPRETRFDRLQYLSQYFDTVEVNTSFYSIPPRALVENWVQSVNHKAEFLFAVKLYKGFTHGEEIQRGQPLIVASQVEAFKGAFLPMLEAGKLGALLLQFPYRFHWEPRNVEYLLSLFETFREFPLVFEARHGSFNTESFFSLLKEQGVAFANIDQPEVSASMPTTQVVTSERLAYLRFHGRNAKAWFAADAGRDSRYDYCYSPEEFDIYLGMIQEFRQRQGTLYVIFNNHYRASEVKNALEFIHRITGKPVNVMPRLLRAYPDLEKIALPEEAVPPGIQLRDTPRLF